LKILVKNAVEKGVSNADMDDVNLEEFWRKNFYEINALTIKRNKNITVKLLNN
jgi:hypothetical protein